MFLARVEGSVVSTKKEASMNGRKLLLLRPQLVDDKDPTKFRSGSNTIIAVDTVGAGDMVVAAFSAARASGASTAECCEFANLCAHISIHKIGETGAASPEEIEKLNLTFL